MNVSFFSTFSGLVPGAVKSADAGGNFVNLYLHPVWIEDIIFNWDWTVTVRNQIKTYGAPMGDTIRARLTYANNPLTNGFVPVNLLARNDDWKENTPSMVIEGQPTHSSFVWKLAQPLWVPPNVKIAVQIQHQNDFVVDIASPAVQVDVTIRGRLDESDAVPAFIDIPYATAFLGAINSTVSVGKTGVAPPVVEQTAQTDLFNPFDVPLNIDRLQYQISVSSHGKGFAAGVNANFAPTDATSAQDQTGLLNAGQNYGLDRRYVTMKMTSSTGRALVKDFAPIGAVISSTDRALDTKAVLDPMHYYIAFLSSQMPLFTDRGPLPFQMRTGLSLVGSRRLTPAETFSTYR